MVPSTQQSGGVNFIRERLKKQNWRLQLRDILSRDSTKLVR
jgi:hypothetical protein